MDNLLAPLKDVEMPDFLKEDGALDTKIPIPSPDFLKRTSVKGHDTTDGKLIKFRKEYEEFCRWSALPKEERKPKTATEFEKKYILPKGYTNAFKARDDYSDKRLNYFWDWMMDLYPDVVHAVYKRAVSKSDKAAQIFIEMLSKKLNLDKPKVQVQPMVLMGVPQDKIDALFTPKGYDNGVIPGEVVKIKK